MDLSLASLLADNRTRYGTVPAYLDGDRVITHGELYHRARALAGALNHAGVRRHDRVALLGRNSIEFGTVLASGQLSGVVVATVNFRFADSEIAHVLTDSAPRLVFVDAEWLATVQRLRHVLAPDVVIVVLDAPGSGDVIGLADFVAGGYEPLDTATPDDVACIIYTSGTTGRPKGCVLGQRELWHLGFQLNADLRTDPGDSVLLVMPMFHIGAMAIGLGVHAQGGTAVLHRQFDPAALVAVVAARGIDVLHLAPVMLQSVLDAAASSPGSLSGVRTVVYSAAPMTPAILDRALTLMPAAGFLNLYGQTECFTSGLGRGYHRNVTTEAARRRLGSVGHPVPGNTVRILNEDGSDVAAGEPGEIVVTGPSVFRGYWNDSAATAATLVDGWLHTGDVGYVDADGLLHLVDRKKDMIITGGENVYSVEVEAALSDHPGVAGCAVVGVPDRRWGEMVCAVVVAPDGTEPTLESLREHAGRTLSRYKLPRRLELVTTLPQLPTGKIDKKALRATLREAQLEAEP